MSQQFQIPRKPPLSSHQTAIDEDETGLTYSDYDETGKPLISKPPTSNMPAVTSKPHVSNMPAVSNTPAVTNKPPVSNMPAVTKPLSNMLPHKLDEILKDADKQIDRSSTQKIYDQLYFGIYLKQKKQKFWVDKNLKNCFMFYAKGLIRPEWLKWDQSWGWPTFKEQESSEASTFEAAELLDAGWLCLFEQFETFKLSPATQYEVVFIVMIKNPSHGWHIPVNLTLKLHDKSNQQHKIEEQHHMENLNEKQRGIWIEIPVGVFTTSPQTDPANYIELCLHEWNSRVRRKGLVVKGACIRPKMNP